MSTPSLAKPPAKFALTLPINAALQTTATKFQYPYEFGIAGRGAYDYTWIYVLGCILCFAMASAVSTSQSPRHVVVDVGRMWCGGSR